MIEGDLVKKEADPLNMNLIDLSFPKRRRQVAERFFERKRSIPSYKRWCSIEFRIGIGGQIVLQIQIMPPTGRYNGLKMPSSALAQKGII